MYICSKRVNVQKYVLLCVCSHSVVEVRGKSTRGLRKVYILFDKLSYIYTYIHVHIHIHTHRHIYLGILTQRWRILFKPITAEATKATKLVRTVCVLHNFLKKTDDKIYCPPGYSDQVSQDGNVTPGFWTKLTMLTIKNEKKVP